MAGPISVQEDEKAVVGKQTYPVESKMSIRSLYVLFRRLSRLL